MAHGELSIEEIKKHNKFYWMIFAGLLVLTAVTVGVAQVHLPIHQAVLLALIVASIKGSLVALYFMHLMEEKKIIYFTLGLTGFFFLVLLCVPWMLY